MIRAVVTDIEGTTSSLQFVKDVLFPYARERLANYVRVHQDDPQVVPLLEEVRRLAGQSLGLEEIIGQLLAWSDADEKVPPLKALQGLIWETGYRQGDFQGHVYPDAVAQLKAWHDAGICLYVFSSGSVAAQKLLFGHTRWGDLTPLFSGFFDTRIGPKRDPESYRKIAAEIDLKSQQILFLSDVKQELEAADVAGMKPIWLVREGHLESDGGYRKIGDFSEIDLVRVS
ncbi:acireductone synthase [Methylohalobius crimeensis]|uniref:acireductone synthase n=1 Tax=Methylohalobius crimeensis TaxID=244365 RepID=UPI0003B4DD90|nr:acireductone synthase [Methylohalobius crimeensis]